jgi:sec-independent protein translocase protein TatA
MNTMFAAMLGGWEIVLILAVVLILFGAKKLPELAKGLGTGIKEFKKATREVTDEISNSMDDNRTYTPPPQNRVEYPPEENRPKANVETAASAAQPTPPKS